MEYISELISKAIGALVTLKRTSEPLRFSFIGYNLFLSNNAIASLLSDLDFITDIEIDGSVFYVTIDEEFVLDVLSFNDFPKVNESIACVINPLEEITLTQLFKIFKTISLGKLLGLNPIVFLSYSDIEFYKFSESMKGIKRPGSLGDVISKYLPLVSFRTPKEQLEYAIVQYAKSQIRKYTQVSIVNSRDLDVTETKKHLEPLIFEKLNGLWLPKNCIQKANGEYTQTMYLETLCFTHKVSMIVSEDVLKSSLIHSYPTRFFFSPNLCGYNTISESLYTISDLYNIERTTALKLLNWFVLENHFKGYVSLPKYDSWTLQTFGSDFEMYTLVSKVKCKRYKATRTFNEFKLLELFLLWNSTLSKAIELSDPSLIIAYVKEVIAVYSTVIIESPNSELIDVYQNLNKKIMYLLSIENIYSI
jgi:hypothetical protein